MKHYFYYLLNHKMFHLNKQTNMFLKPINETVKLGCYIMSDKK